MYTFFDPLQRFSKIPGSGVVKEARGRRSGWRLSPGSISQRASLSPLRKRLDPFFYSESEGERLMIPAESGFVRHYRVRVFKNLGVFEDLISKELNISSVRFGFRDLIEIN